uniref:NAC domain-containing protein n=1 Tax=Triticum urartu TaxID=4572 RepID=A0A8R7TJQ0_TRIUA
MWPRFYHLRCSVQVQYRCLMHRASLEEILLVGVDHRRRFSMLDVLSASGNAYSELLCSASRSPGNCRLAESIAFCQSEYLIMIGHVVTKCMLVKSLALQINQWACSALSSSFFRNRGPFIVTGKIIATMIRNGELVPEAGMECPNCEHRIDNSDVSSQWPGLPIGVKFDPTDLELLGHLEGKIGRAMSHVLIDDFIPTIEMAEGICYTHPENLPGVRLDGVASHFFHKICNAYDVGTRKRRKISNSDYNVCDEHLRWHKTGKSRHILDNNGDIKGWKKIMVLRKGGYKAEKTNWTMHQYHLGVDENEKDGELVVCKVFFQLPSEKAGQSVMFAVDEESDSFAVKIDPTTPMTYAPQPCRPNGSPSETEQNQEEEEFRQSAVRGAAEWLAGTSSHAVDDVALPALDEHPSRGGTPDAAYPEKQHLPLVDTDALQGFPDLGTSPHFSSLADMQFDSLDCFNSWLDRM